MNAEIVTRQQYETAVAQASQAGAEIARKRFDEIMALDGATNFPGLARKIALEMNMPASEAAAIFAAAMVDRTKLPAGLAPQREQPGAERAARESLEVLARTNRFVEHRARMKIDAAEISGRQSPAAENGWKKAVARANAAYGLK